MNSISPKVTGYLAPLVSRSKIIVQPLARASSAMNVSKLRGALPQSWFKNKYEVKNLSIAVAEIKTADGGVERIMSVSGNAWHGVNAPKSTITWQGKTYNIVKVDPKNLPTNVNNANHAEKRLFEYINSNYSNKAINVKIAVENTSRNNPGMCGGCGTSINDLSTKLPKMKIQMFQGSTKINP